MKATNKMVLRILSKPENERFARTACAAFLLELDPTLEEMSEIKTAKVQSLPANNAGNGAIAKAKKMNFANLIKSDAVQASLSQTLGDAARTKTFTASLISAVSTNPMPSSSTGISVPAREPRAVPATQ